MIDLSKALDNMIRGKRRQMGVSEDEGHWSR